LVKHATFIEKNARSAHDAHDALAKPAATGRQKARGQCRGARLGTHHGQEALQVCRQVFDLRGVDEWPAFAATDAVAPLSEGALEPGFIEIDDGKLRAHGQSSMQSPPVPREFRS